MKVEEYKESSDSLAGWQVKIISYKLGSTYYVSINNVEPGAWIVKGSGFSLDVAQAQAREQATEYLSKTRRNPPPAGCTSVPGA